MRSILTFAGLALATATLAAPASAVVVTFASFSARAQQGTTLANVRWVNTGGTGRNAQFYTTATATSNTAGSRLVNFSFLQPSIAPFVTNVSALWTLNGTVTNTVATVNGTQITQNNINGSFSFKTVTAITVGSRTYAAGSDLLSGTFTQASIAGTRNGSSAGFAGSTPTSSITYTSDFLTFVPNANYDFSIALTQIAPLLNATNAANQITGAPNKALRTFRAVAGGQFSSDPPPIPNVPEPAVWAQLIAGFTLVGIATRRRKANVAA